MSFYSYKNGNADSCPGMVGNNVLSGLNERICVQVKNIYDSCMQQEQLDDVMVTVNNIVPVMPDPNCRSNGNASRGCACNCRGNACTCQCQGCSDVLTHDQAVHNAENSPCPLPSPCGQWTFESCRSASTRGTIRNLTIDRMCDRPQFARIKGVVDIPIDVLFTDENCQEWMGTATISVQKDVLLAIPEESIVPFTLESLVSAICVTGDYRGNCRFEITVCITVVLKILAECGIMIPTYGFCQIPPCEEFAENVCDEFFSLPLFPQRTFGSGMTTAETTSIFAPANGNGVAGMMGGCANGNCMSGNCMTGCVTSTCSNCGTTCGSANSSLCPRCGCTMTCN